MKASGLKLRFVQLPLQQMGQRVLIFTDVAVYTVFLKNFWTLSIWILLLHLLFQLKCFSFWAKLHHLAFLRLVSLLAGGGETLILQLKLFLNITVVLPPMLPSWSHQQNCWRKLVKCTKSSLATHWSQLVPLLTMYTENGLTLWCFTWI